MILPKFNAAAVQAAPALLEPDTSEDKEPSLPVLAEL
ncbi:hypothetical protein J2S90_001751 [Arthrobacter bambusae]|uniref:Uncharacterized protein n=1 Tax=Arthrobacter bambusae TaxID=1338426 RepID=A0AAW8D7B0_9MICC|nr:hypothetical protein [Arthrobacter bambusae]MDQ0129612.1 hypothetical protein [Arthrobacter bambusae]MDQ0180775.1 hypothetical protein [Arthrobacter bambusae]